MPLCAAHHVPWAHKSPAACRAVAIGIMGSMRYYELLRKSNSIVKESEFDFAGTKTKLERILNE